MTCPKAKKLIKEGRETVKNKVWDKLYYTMRSLFGYIGIVYFWLIGARGRGKSFSAVDAFLSFQKKYGEENVLVYWFRVSDLSVKALLANKAKKAIDAVLVRKYKLDITTKCNQIYNRGKPIASCYALVSAAKTGKGVAEYDPEFLNNQPEGVRRYIFIIVDEFMVDASQEKKTVGDPLSQFRIFMENILRDQQHLNYDAVKVIGCANSVSECGDWIGRLCNFIPEAPGRYVLRRKHTIIDQIPNSESYIQKRKTAITADIMDMDDANYTNQVKRDIELLVPKNYRLGRVCKIIKFTKDPIHWYTLWDDNVIRRYKNQPHNREQVIAMQRYLDESYSAEIAKSVIERYDARNFKYADLISLANFASDLKLVKRK